MGTRHLIAATLDGDFRLAQYGQWDGYPAGQGLKVLAFLRQVDLDRFAQRLQALRWATPEDLAAALRSLGIEGEWMNLAQSEAWERTFPQWSRDTGADVLTLVYEGRAHAVVDERDFALDGLFCEWAYLIDLDARALEVYRGFFPDGAAVGRFADQRERRDAGDRSYDPVSLVASFPLDNLPGDEEFLATFHETED